MQLAIQLSTAFAQAAPASTDLPIGLQTGSTARTDLQPCPLEPSWIMAGSPVARALPLGKSDDGQFTYGLWDCTGGEFNFSYYCDEVIHILEGEVTIRAGGVARRLHAGDVAFFPQGMTAHWTVHGYVRKFAIFRSVQRSLLTRILGKARRVALALTAFPASVFAGAIRCSRPSYLPG